MDVYDDYLKSISIPRMMGTEGEKKTNNYLKKTLISFGLKPTGLEFQYSHGMTHIMKIIFSTLILFIIALNWMKNLHPLYTIVTSVIILTTLGIIGIRMLNFNIPNIGKKHMGENIIAQIEPKGETQGEILVSGHYDSISSSIPTPIYKGLIFSTVLLAISIGLVVLISNIIEILQIFNIAENLSNIVIICDNVLLIFSIPIIILFIIIMLNKHENLSDGACDNATGCAIMLKLAENFTNGTNGNDNQLKNTKIKFLFTAGEELGLFGSRDYVKKNMEAILKSKVKFFQINVDMVGSEIAYLKKAGLFSKKPLSFILNKVIEDSADERNIQIRPFSSMVGSSSDHAPFKKLKLDVCDFTSMKDKQIHSKNDTLEKIDKNKLYDAVELIMTMIHKLDEEYISH